MPKNIYQWDQHSDQPHVIRSKTAKRKLYLRGAKGSVKTLLCSFILPLTALRALLDKRRGPQLKINNIGLCVNIDEPLPEKKVVDTQSLCNMVSELGVDNLLIRLPLADIKNLEEHLNFIASFANKNILICILQDRRHIEDHSLLENSLRLIFSALEKHCLQYQIGNAVNRRKWGFISLEEYFAFFAIAQTLRDNEFPHIKLLGSSIIDFELPNFARSLYHRYPIKYDAVAALLYVDRRGAPENKQLGVNLLGKINSFFSIISSSKKSENELLITETNWPLEGTEPFAPAVGECMVSEDMQTAYLLRYYFLMFASGKVSMCYWHQLVAPGYGLVDNRNGEIRKREAFYAFKLLVTLFNNAQLLTFEYHKSTQLYRLSVRNSQGVVTALWTNATTLEYSATNSSSVLSCTGKVMTQNAHEKIIISDHPTYLLDYNFET